MAQLPEGSFVRGDKTLENQYMQMPPSTLEIPYISCISVYPVECIWRVWLSCRWCCKLHVCLRIQGSLLSTSCPSIKTCHETCPVTRIHERTSQHDRDVARKHTDQTRIHRQHAKTITHRDIEETQKVHHKQTSWHGLPFPAQRMEVDSRLSSPKTSTATPCRWTHHPGDGSFIPSRRISPLALLSYIDKIPMRWPQRCSNCALAPGQRCINCQRTKTGTCSWGSAQNDNQHHKEHHVSDSKIQNKSLQRPHQSQL